MVQVRSQRRRRSPSAQVIALERRKGKLVDELRRLQGALGSAADSVARQRQRAPAWNEAGDTETIELPLQLHPPDTDTPTDR